MTRLKAVLVAALFTLFSVFTLAQTTAPTLSGIVVGSTVLLSWTTLPGATSYWLEAGSQPGLSDAFSGDVGPSPGLTTAAPPGTYFVRVRGRNGSLFSAPSNEVVVTVGGGGCLAPGAPSGLVATPGLLAVTITWVAPATGGVPTDYVLDVGSASGLSNLGSFPLPNSTSLISPAPAGTYFVRLRAANSCGSSAASAQISFTVTAATAVGPLPAGTYVGMMFNNSRPGLGRPPITAFQLTLNQPLSATGFGQISARWADNAGCTRTTNIFGGTSAGRSWLSVESLTCNDGDMILSFTSINGAVVEGTCNGGSNCRFRMTRQ